MSLAGRVVGGAVLAAVVLAGCKKDDAAAGAAAGGAPQAMPVQVQPVTLTPVPSSDTYVSTIKSRRSATMQPQVDGNLTKILVKSGDRVQAGQVLMTIDPLKQQATVQQQVGAEAQQKAVYQYNQADVERQRQLFQAGVISKQAYDQAVQAYQNSQGAYNAATAQTSTQREQLKYYDIRAPFSGVVGDIPVHVGDYVSATTLLTTVDEVADLEAYIYIPTERAGDIRLGLPVEILDTAGNSLAKTQISFVSPEVNNGLQGILAKASIPASARTLRTEEIVNARVTWNTNPAPVVPVLAVSLIGGQSFVFIAAPQPKGGFAAHQIAVKLGDAVGNNYPVLSGLQAGQKVIVSGLQILQEGMPVMPLPPQA